MTNKKVSKSMTKRVLAILLSLVLVLAMAGCGASGSNDAAAPAETSEEAPAETSEAEEGDSEAAPATAGELAYEGTISFYAQAYQPGEPTESNPEPPVELRRLAEEWQAMHPGIDIDFITAPDGDYEMWLMTQLSGGQAPDIVWAQNAHLRGGSTFPVGSFTNLRPFMDERPNHYVDGNAAWTDLFHDSILQQLYDSNGELWQLNGDFVATAVVFNQAMFESAGITDVPLNWTEYIEVSEKLQEAGHTPWAFPFSNDGGALDRFTWLARLFYTNYYGPQFEEMAVLGSETALSPAEVALAFVNGIYDVNDPMYLSWWQFIKDQTKYMPDDFLSATNDDSAIQTMFVNENIAMYFDGSWANRNLRIANPAFDFGMFPFPIPDAATDSFASSVNSANSIGGPSAAFQFSVPSERGNNSLTDEKLEAIIDWMMFISTPENNSSIVNELGSFVPTVIGATANPGSESILESLSERSMMLDGGTGVFGQAFVDLSYRTFQEFLGDRITLEQAASTLAPMALQAAEDIIREAEEDLTEYIKD